MDFLESGLTSFGLLWIAIHVIGLIAAWMVRLRSGKSYEVIAQSGFFTSLLAVALTVVIGFVCCLEMWPLSAVTLAVMIVLAIADLGSADAEIASFES